MSLLDMVVALHVNMVVQYLLLVTEFVTCSEYFVDFSTFFFLSCFPFCSVWHSTTTHLKHTTPSPNGWLKPKASTLFFVPVAEPPPLGFHHMFGNEELECKSWRMFADSSLKTMAMKLGRWDVIDYRY